jgi:hypothetical protein
MGTSLAMIDLHYGHLALDGREHAVALLDALAADETAWTFGGRWTEDRKAASARRFSAASRHSRTEPWTFGGRRAARASSIRPTEGASMQERS